MVQRILVTGASGFLGAHIVNQAIKDGYRVRATARGPKVEQLKKSYEKHGDKFEVVAIYNIDTDQFAEALEGVDAVIHSASALAGKEAPEVLLNNTIEGTLNLVKQVEKAGIKRIVVVSSMATVLHPKMTFTDKDWNPATRESIINGTPMAAYHGAKTLAEKALWEFADAHPHLDVTTVNPPFLYGPFADGFPLPVPNTGLSSNIIIQNLLSPTGIFPNASPYTDVRDVARALVLALTSPPASQVGRKRVLLSSPHGLDFSAAIELIREKRPELVGRVNKGEPPKFPFDRILIDFARVEEVLGMKKGEFLGVEETILDAVDSVVRIEKAWEAQGHEVVVAKVDLSI